MKENKRNANSATKNFEWLKNTKIINKRVVKYIIILLVFLFITNPTLIPFLPGTIKSQLTNALIDIFGDVTRISDVIQINWITIFQLVVMVLILMIITNIVKGVMRNINPKSGRAKTFLSLLNSISKYLSIFIGIIWGFTIIGVNVSTIFASVGIAALVVGFSAESLIADIVTGLFLLFENQYNVGDIIEVGDFRGTIVNIGIRTTSISDAGGNIKAITNSDMRNVINRSCTASKAVCDIVVPISENIVRIENVLLKILKEVKEKNSDILLEEPKYIGIQNLNEADMVLRIIATTEEKDIFNVQRLINREIKRGLEFERVKPFVSAVRQ